MFHKCVLPTCAEYVFDGKLSTDRISSIVGAKNPFSILIITALLRTSCQVLLEIIQLF